MCRRLHPGGAAGRQAHVCGFVNHEPAGQDHGRHRCTTITSQVSKNNLTDEQGLKRSNNATWHIPKACQARCTRSFIRAASQRAPPMPVHCSWKSWLLVLNVAHNELAVVLPWLPPSCFSPLSQKRRSSTNQHKLACHLSNSNLDP